MVGDGHNEPILPELKFEYKTGWKLYKKNLASTTAAAAVTKTFIFWHICVAKDVIPILGMIVWTWVMMTVWNV